jgi:beta-propeller repeat-containing protein/HYDIN/CFA65/VesB family protein
MPLSRQILGALAGVGLALLPVSTGGAALSEHAPKPAKQANIQPILRPSSIAGAAKAHLAGSYGKLPLSFEVNQGQASEQVKFLTHGPGYTLFLTQTEALLSLDTQKSGSRDLKEEHHALSRRSRPWPGSAEKEHSTNDLVRMRLVGANPTPEFSGMDELPGKVNYFVGNDQKNWRSNIPTYSNVRYKNVYPGIDLVYYSREGQLEYDFVVQPGADPSVIALGFEGASDGQRLPRLRMDKTGNVLIEGGSSALRLTKPVVYQPKVSTTRTSSQSVARNTRSVRGHFVLTSSNQVRFELGPYDKSQPLVIDPGLVYSTFLGFQGSGSSMAVDSSGNLFITGPTNQPNFPTTPGASNTTGGVAFVAKVNSTGSALVYTTYFGGTTNTGIGGESGPFIALDSSDNVYLTGYTTATDFPVTTGAFQTKLEDTQGCIPFVSKLNPTGSKLVYSTYLGGKAGINVGYAITVDSAGNAYVAGLASGSDFPTTPGAFQTVNNGGASPGISGDAFVTEVKPDGSGLVFSTFLGGTTGGNFASSVVVDSTGAIYVAGGTAATDFPTKNPYQATLSGTGFNGFLTKFAPGGSTLDYSTYFGSAGSNLGATVVGVDALGEAYVAGGSLYAKFNTAGSSLIYSAPGLPAGSGFAVDASENIYVAGQGNTAGLPLANAIQDTYNGGNDCYIGVVNLKTSALVFGSYLGGSEREFGCGAALDSTGHVYITGWTASVNFPLLAGGLSSSFTCCTNAFLTKIDLSAAATPRASVTPTNLTFQATTGGTQTVTVKNTGNTALNISKVGFQVASNSFGETDTCTGATIAAGSSCSVDVTFMPQTAENDPGLLSISYNGAGSPLFVTLTVVDYSFTPSAQSLVLKAGASGSFNLLVLPLGGLSGTTVTISCTGAPAESTCNPSPSSVGLDGLHGGIVKVAVSTSAATAALRPPNFPFLTAAIFTLPLGLMAFPLVGIRRRTIRPVLWVLALVLLLLALLPSCGGGGVHVPPPPPSPGTPAGTYTLTVTGSSGSVSHSVPISLTVN